MSNKLSLPVIIALLALLFSSPASAIKINADTGFASSFHIGAVSGPGLGINFGLDAGLPAGEFELGAEVEQLITDYNFEISVNVTRLGMLVRYEALKDFLTFGAHAGRTWFSVSRDTSFRDMLSGQTYSLLSGKKLDAAYGAVSAEFDMGEYTITPKVCVNYIGDGAMMEFDLNLGTSF